MKAALLGVHRGDAARCCVSFTPPLAKRSMLGVLEQRLRSFIATLNRKLSLWLCTVSHLSLTQGNCDGTGGRKGTQHRDSE